MGGPFRTTRTFYSSFAREHRVSLTSSHGWTCIDHGHHFARWSCFVAIRILFSKIRILSHHHHTFYNGLWPISLRCVWTLSHHTNMTKVIEFLLSPTIIISYPLARNSTAIARRWPIRKRLLASIWDTSEQVEVVYYLSSCIDASHPPPWAAGTADPLRSCHTLNHNKIIISARLRFIWTRGLAVGHLTQPGIELEARPFWDTEFFIS